MGAHLERHEKNLNKMLKCQTCHIKSCVSNILLSHGLDECEMHKSGASTIKRSKQTPGETSALRNEVNVVYLPNLPPVLPPGPFLLKTYLFVKSVPSPPGSWPSVPLLALTWLILFPGTGSTVGLQLWHPLLFSHRTTHLPPHLSSALRRYTQAFQTFHVNMTSVLVSFLPDSLSTLAVSHDLLLHMQRAVISHGWLISLVFWESAEGVETVSQSKKEAYFNIV